MCGIMVVGGWVLLALKYNKKFLDLYILENTNYLYFSTLFKLYIYRYLVLLKGTGTKCTVQKIL
jgi:uncharacterized protein (DUF1919 family)